LTEDLRRKVKQAIRFEVPDFEKFEKIALDKLNDLPDDLKAVTSESLRDPDFRANYATLRDAYERAALEMSLDTPDELASQKVVEKAKENLKQRGFKFKWTHNYERTKEGTEKRSKELDVEIESKFLSAIGGLISKIIAFF